jgi:hypothetical protein
MRATYPFREHPSRRGRSTLIGEAAVSSPPAEHEIDRPTPAAGLGGREQGRYPGPSANAAYESFCSRSWAARRSSNSRGLASKSYLYVRLAVSRSSTATKPPPCENLRDVEDGLIARFGLMPEPALRLVRGLVVARHVAVAVARHEGVAVERDGAMADVDRTDRETVNMASRARTDSRVIGWTFIEEPRMEDPQSHAVVLDPRRDAYGCREHRAVDSDGQREGVASAHAAALYLPSWSALTAAREAKTNAPSTFTTPRPAARSRRLRQPRDLRPGSSAPTGS